MDNLKISELFSSIEEISFDKGEKLLSFLTTDEIAQVLDIILDKLEAHKYLKVDKVKEELIRVPLLS